MHKEIKLRTRHELALEMLDGQGSLLPHACVEGNDERGRSSGCRREWQGRGECYLLAVPSHTLARDLNEPPPAYAGRDADAVPRDRSRGWIADARRSRKTPGPRSTSETTRRGRW